MTERQFVDAIGLVLVVVGLALFFSGVALGIFAMWIKQ